MDHQTISNCHKTLQKLIEFLAISENINQDYTRAAVIQAFEFTFEVYWKTFQKLGQAEGLSIASPKAAFLYGYQAGIIKNESAWLNILKDRNLTTHTYHDMLAKEIYARIKAEYLFEFQAVYEALTASLKD